MNAFSTQRTRPKGAALNRAQASAFLGDTAMERKNSRMTQDNPPKVKPSQPPVAFDPVEAALKQIFNDVASEDVPDDFADLVAQLTTRSPEKKDT